MPEFYLDIDLLEFLQQQDIEQELENLFGAWDLQNFHQVPVDAWTIEEQEERLQDIADFLNEQQ